MVKKLRIFRQDKPRKIQRENWAVWKRTYPTFEEMVQLVTGQQGHIY